MEWYKDAIIYHIYALSLANAPAVNDYTQRRNTVSEIEKWIPHIKGMGFNTVLFSPVLKSKSHGYDVTDYYEIDNRIGTNGGFQSLVKTFHDNGIRVIIDCVFNHCGRDFFAFKELQNRNMNYAGWFSGVDFSKQSPMGDPFTYDTWSGHFKLPKFNLKNASVKEYLLSAARLWIDTFDIDGMRLDAADVLDKNFMTELRHVTEEKKNDFWLMGEVVHGDYSKWVNAQTLHSVTNYFLYKSLYSSHNENNLFELAHCLETSVPANGLPLLSFLDNHDQNRIASAVSNPAHLNTLYALLFTLPGIPCVYFGSEWGIRGEKEKYSDSPLRPYIDIEKRYDFSAPLTGYINKLISIRQNESALKYGSYKKLYLEYDCPFMFKRSYENQRIIVAVNIKDRDDFIDLNSHCINELTDLLSGECITPQYYMIKPHSVLILKESHSSFS
ncbi:MAG: alpha-amylase [Treponema sp.]|jgi:glycosidase|nr:alpha-amylase [Treponema sp.]